MLIITSLLLLIAFILAVVGDAKGWGLNPILIILIIGTAIVFGIALSEHNTSSYSASKYKQEVKYEITIVNNDTICDTIYSFIKK